MIVVAVDPSGEFDKGKGTTGLSVVETIEDGTVHIRHWSTVYAGDFSSKFMYWYNVWQTIRNLATTFGVEHLIIEDYILYAKSAKAQINSEMETSKMIGMLAFNLTYIDNLKVHLNIAANVMNRWSDKVLEHEGLDLTGINKHALDSIRHGVHGVFFLVKKEKYER